MKHTHSDRLERWLGAAAVRSVSDAMRGFYHPIAVHGVPGSVYAMPGGDFAGEIRAGHEVSAVERALDVMRRERAGLRASLAGHKIAASQSLRGRMDRRQHAFASLSAIVAAQTGGKGQPLNFSKVGLGANGVGGAGDMWTRAGQPSAGAAGGAAPGGTPTTSATAGAMVFGNPVNANTSHFTTGYVSANFANTLLLYDRLFSVAKTINSTATEAVTGVPTRYQNGTATAEDYIGGNFCTVSNPTTVLAGTGHSWTVCQYTNQASVAARSFPSAAGVSGCAVGAIDLTAGNWFMPLQAGDVGVKALTQMQCSALVATGTVDFVLGHPIAFFPCPIANMVCPVDGIYSAFNLTRIYDNAALAFIEMPKPAATATTYNGLVQIVAE